VAGKLKPDDACGHIVPNKAKMQRLSCEIMLARRLLRRANRSGMFMVQKAIDARRRAIEYLRAHDAYVPWGKLYKKFKFTGYMRSTCKTTSKVRKRIQELNSVQPKNACDAR
jgi:hypothetical protein